MGLCSDGVGDDTEDASSDEQESDRREGAESDEEEAGPSVVIMLETGRNGSGFADGNIGIDRGNLSSSRAAHSRLKTSTKDRGWATAITADDMQRMSNNSR